MGSVVWGGTSNSNIHKLYILQKRLCKIVLGKDYVSVANSMAIMSSLTIQDRILLNKAKFMYKISKGLVPGYVTSVFVKDQTKYTNLRFSNYLNYIIPRPRLEQFKQSISYSGPSLWNRIPDSIRCSKTIDSFTTHFIRWLKSVQ